MRASRHLTSGSEMPREKWSVAVVFLNFSPQRTQCDKKLHHKLPNGYSFHSDLAFKEKQIDL